MKSGEAARHADLDAGVVGHKSTFYEIGQTKFLMKDFPQVICCIIYTPTFTKMILLWIHLLMVSLLQNKGGLYGKIC
jgi:hypothetical protein